MENQDRDTAPMPEILKSLFDVNIVEPTKLFDNVAYVGYRGVGSFAIHTSDGIIVIDTMWTYQDGKNVIVPGIKKLGWNPADIKYVLITHGHFDHYGSARFFEDAYDATTFMSKVDWELMMDPDAPALKDPFGNFSIDCLKPTQYEELTDGQTVTLGDTSVSVFSTPGHTPGGVSFIVPVKDDGNAHAAAIWGGTGLPRSLEDNETYLKSLDYFADAAEAANVDVEISIHPFVNHLLEKIEILQSRKPGDPNPVVIGKEAVKRYWDEELRKNVVSKIAELKQR